MNTLILLCKKSASDGITVEDMIFIGLLIALFVYIHFRSKSDGHTDMFDGG